VVVTEKPNAAASLKNYSTDFERRLHGHEGDPENYDTARNAELPNI
jgi:hypothetical protein